MPSLTPTSWRETKIPNRTKFGLLRPGDRYKCRHGIGNQRKRQEIFVKLRFMIETYWKPPLHDQNKIILRIILKRLILVQKGHTISRELENRHENNNSNTSLQTLTGKMTRAKIVPLFDYRTSQRHLRRTMLTNCGREFFESLFPGRSRQLRHWLFQFSACFTRLHSR